MGTTPARLRLADYLITELAAVRAENKHLRRRVANLERSRDRWKREARDWKWGYLRATR